MGVVGIAKKGFGKALKAYKSRQRAKRIAKGISKRNKNKGKA